jgi:hypothetical protein
MNAAETEGGLLSACHLFIFRTNFYFIEIQIFQTRDISTFHSDDKPRSNLVFFIKGVDWFDKVRIYLKIFHMIIE